jgi:formylglycine-generating enzyme required for sulfatase activity
VKRERLGLVVAAILAAVALRASVSTAQEDVTTTEDEDEEGASSSETSPPRPTVTRGVDVPLTDGMLRIPGARFTIGSVDTAAPPNERASMLAIVSSFWIDRTEVTVAAFRACVVRGACARPARTSASCTYDLGDPMLPISCVRWDAARAYCVAMGKRLPREIEWELAARGTQDIRYPWGGARPSCAAAVTLVNNATQRTCGKRKWPARVGTHPIGASPFGVQDMSGNVEEWVEDFYAPQVSPLSPRAGASHVLRGGGFLSAPSASRTTSRNWGSVYEAGPNVGFRCARDASE